VPVLSYQFSVLSKSSTGRSRRLPLLRTDN